MPTIGESVALLTSFVGLIGAVAALLQLRTRATETQLKALQVLIDELQEKNKDLVAQNLGLTDRVRELECELEIERDKRTILLTRFDELVKENTKLNELITARLPRRKT